MFPRISLNKYPKILLAKFFFNHGAIWIGEQRFDIGRKLFYHVRANIREALQGADSCKTIHRLTSHGEDLKSTRSALQILTGLEGDVVAVVRDRQIDQRFRRFVRNHIGLVADAHANVFKHSVAIFGSKVDLPQATCDVTDEQN